MTEYINKCGIMVFGIVFPEDFARVIIEMADKRGKTPQDMVIELAIQGAEHMRLCRDKK